MRHIKIVIFYLFITVAFTAIFFTYIIKKPTAAADISNKRDSFVKFNIIKADTAIHTNNTMPQELVSYAQKFIGKPYVYASSDSAVGFDCSGFITFVFNHFDIKVPRSSVEFTNVPYEIPVDSAKPADLILFNGTDSTIRTVGHMGIIVYNQNNELLFIHSSSGKANGVTITPLNEYYKARFVKVIRVFRQNESNS